MHVESERREKRRPASEVLKQKNSIYLPVLPQSRGKRAGSRPG